MLGHENKLTWRPCAVQKGATSLYSEWECAQNTSLYSVQEPSLYCEGLYSYRGIIPARGDFSRCRYSYWWKSENSGSLCASEAFVSLLGASPSPRPARTPGSSVLEAQAYVKVTPCVALMHCISGFPHHSSCALETCLPLLPFLNRKEILNYNPNVRDMTHVTKKKLGYSLLYLCIVWQ